jgi:hypothetical protein
MTERELQEAVIELAHVYGWKIAHFRPAMNARGDWRTPVAADGKGFPDLVMVSAHALLFVELKSDKGKVTPEQLDWINRLMHKSHEWDKNTTGVNEYMLGTDVWRPSDWTNGAIEKILKDWA